MKATISIDTENLEVVCRCNTENLDEAESVNSIARSVAASIAAMLDLPHLMCDVNVGEFFEYRENISASTDSLFGS